MQHFRHVDHVDVESRQREGGREGEREREREGVVNQKKK